MKYKSGDTVKIKSWAEMEQEFGLSEGHDINCDMNFYPDLEKEMPKNRIIKLGEEIIRRNGKPWYDWNLWSITSDMIAYPIDETCPELVELNKSFAVDGLFEETKKLKEELCQK